MPARWLGWPEGGHRRGPGFDCGRGPRYCAGMDHPLIDLINARIAAAEAEGAFDDLPGAGKPLPRCDDPENALINRLMKENGATPEFVTRSRELARLREELRETGDRTRRHEIMKEMSMMDARIELARKAFSR